jgi:hypothetical protein
LQKKQVELVGIVAVQLVYRAPEEKYQLANVQAITNVVVVDLVETVCVKPVKVHKLVQMIV